MTFRIQGLSPEPFRALFALSDYELVAHNARRVFADVKPGFPCRVSLQDAEPGEELLLVNHEHQSAPTPYRASHAVYVRRAAQTVATADDQLPPALQGRLLSLRAFDGEGMMLDGEVAQDGEAIALVERFLSLPHAQTVHIHSARRGCYLARAERA
jgi:hypothetical protein